MTATVSRPRSKWVVGISLVVVAIVGLATWAILSPGALAYYKSPSDLASDPGSVAGHTVRVGGRVSKLQRAGSTVGFTIGDGHNAIAVAYRGEIPDTLKNGTDAIAEGTYEPGRTFRADHVQAKCSSKFVPKGRPGDLGKGDG